MHLDEPRIPPLTDEQLTPAQREALAPASYANTPPLNIFRTLARAPEALSAFLAWGLYILRNNSLPPREREIVILRIGYLCRAGYEWTQHVAIARRGMSEAEIDAIKTGADAPVWSPADAALLRACDDLHARQFVAADNWAALKAHFNERQCMDVVFTAGQYTQVSMMLNTFGVQLEDGKALDPDLDARG
ncbi:MAG TPA: carboxymuconolactone decarboxylase family protein [Vitreimonas sp.]|uniref:carboxymuconolactone decarboxylase family protein n=1 Tax=Vitreimonas sp. TaxID=3069702 RepID=UPI002D275F9A|nr:carboxymuconolactone decarboxylase family protein [Vitreimonas sp.]HYD88753.1 carboxymuconolactone decarboxylase family protein [Vitreimonas sp.]